MKDPGDEMKYEFGKYTYPQNYGNGLAGKTFRCVDAGKGLVVLPLLDFSRQETGYWLVVHRATGRGFSEHKSIKTALKTAAQASAIFDFTRIKTVRGWLRILRRDKELTKKLREIAGR